MAYSTQVLADSPWLYWRLSEAAGSSTIADSSGNSRNGAVINPTSQGLGAASLLNSAPTNGGFLQAATSPYATPYLNDSDIATLLSGNAVTIEAWVKLGEANTSTAPRIFGKGGFYLSLGSSATANRPRFGMGYNGSSTSTLDGPSDLTPGQTYHLAATATFNGTQVVQRLYVNGVEAASKTQAATSFGSNSTTKIAIGASLLDNLTLSTPLPKVAVDEPAIYPSALSASRIQAHYDYGVATLLANTVAPAVTGTARVGETLSTTDGTWTGTTPITYARAWERSDNGSTGWTAISGATASTYTLTSADAGKYVRSKITATNLLGSETATSTSTSQVTETPANTVAPSFSYSGSLGVGQVLTGSAGTWTGFPTPDLTYAWQRSSNGSTGWSSISGATASTYTTTSADAGQYVRLQVTGSNTAGSASASSTSDGPVLWVPVNTAAPSVSYSGSLEVSRVLVAATGSWSGYPTPDLTYAWQRSANGSTGWSNISGATSSSYTTTTDDAGQHLRIQITGTNTAGSNAATSSSVGPVLWAPANTVAPSFSYSGSFEVGTVLTDSPGTWTGYPTPDLTYAWQRSSNGTTGWTSISGATASTYTATSDDAGKHLRLSITGTNTAGSASATSTAAGPVLWAPANTVLPALTHSGLLEVGNQITASSGTWTGFPTPDLSYQWQRSTNGSTNWTSISGATSSTYTPTGTDAGKYLRCRVLGESTSGSATVFSAASGYVASDPATVTAPFVTGILRPGQILTADVGTWSGFPNPSFTYQWFKSPTGSTGWEAIPGKTDPTLTIPGGSLAVGRFFRVEVTGINEAGSASAASAAVGPVTGGSNATAAIVGALVTHCSAPTV